MKTCIKCKEEKPLSEFHKDTTRDDGYSNQCKICRKENRKNYYNRFAELENYKAKQWSKDNRDRKLETRRAWHKLHPEKYKQYYIQSKKNKELKMQFRLITLPTKFISTYEFNPTARTQEKALIELENDIKNSKTIVPIYVRQDPEKGYIVIDGNRRLTVAKKLKYDKIQCIISEEQGGSDADYFILLNKQRRLNSVEQTEFAKNTGKFITKKFEENYNFILNIGGQDLIDLMLESKQNPVSIKCGILCISSYVNDYDKGFMLKSANWMIENRAYTKSRAWIAEGKSKDVLKKCITTNIKLPK